jgi:hypothetical protein
VGLVTLYEHEEVTVICPALTAQPQHRRDAGRWLEDMAADLVAALALSGLELCVQLGEGRACIGIELAAGGYAMDAGVAGAGPWDGPWPQ